MDLGLSQRQVARRLGTHLCCVRKWEVGRTTPRLRIMPLIIEFMGDKPWDVAETLGERIRDKRQACGLSQEETAELLGVGCNKLRRWETGGEEPSAAYLSAIDSFLNGHSLI